MICFLICFKSREPSCIPPAKARLRTAHLFDVNLRIVASLTYCLGEFAFKDCWEDLRRSRVCLYASTGLRRAFWTWAVLDPAKECKLSLKGLGEGERASSSTFCIWLTSTATKYEFKALCFNLDQGNWLTGSVFEQGFDGDQVLAFQYTDYLHFAVWLSQRFQGRNMSFRLLICWTAVSTTSSGCRESSSPRCRCVWFHFENSLNISEIRSQKGG